MPGEYTEPTNEQLARFLTVYIPAQAGLDLHPSVSMVEHLLETQPGLREKALVHHRKFQQQIDEVTRMRMAGELTCEFTRPNGKRCPNYNEPGSFYCGLHQDADKEL